MKFKKNIIKFFSIIFFTSILGSNFAYCSNFSKKSNIQVQPIEFEIQGVLKEGLPIQTFSIIEDFEGNIWTSSELGVYKYNRLLISKMEWFENKKEVLKICSNGRKLFFFHKNYDISILENEVFKTIEYSKVLDPNEYQIKNLIDVELSILNENFYILQKTKFNDELNIIEFYTKEQRHTSQKAGIKIKNSESEKYSIEFEDKNRSNEEKYSFKKIDIYLKVSSPIKNSINNKLKSYNLFISSTSTMLLSNKGERYNIKFDGRIKEVFEDFEGNIWITTISNGVWFFDLKILEKKIFKVSDFGYSDFLKCRVNSNDNFVMFSKKYGFHNDVEMNGLYSTKYLREKIGYYFNKDDTLYIGYDGIMFNHKLYSLYDKVNSSLIWQDFVFLGTNSGLYVFNFKQNSLKKIFNKKINDLVLCNSQILFSSINKIYKLKLDLESSIYYVSKKEILDLFAQGNKLYFSTIDNVSVLERSIITIISEANYIKHIYVNQDDLYISDNNYIYKLLVSNLKTRVKPYLYVNDLSKQEFKNRLNESRILSFNAIVKSNYNKTAKLKYKLVRNGETVLNNIVDHGWISISNLNKGKYQFIISGINDLGIESSVQFFDIEVRPFFYETNFFIIFIIFITLSLIYLLFIYILSVKSKRNLRYRLILENENYQLQLLRSQLNPHFLFNALNSLKSLIYLNKYDTAAEYTDNLSRFLRSILETGIEHSVKLSREIELIRSYFYIEKRRLGNKIELSIDCSYDLMNYNVPSNILQPIIENSIKYGLASNIEKLEVKVNVSLKDSLLLIIIEDNSRKVIEPKVEGTSFSLNSIQKRINLFNKNSVKNSLQLIEIDRNGTKLGVRVIIKLVTLD